MDDKIMQEKVNDLMATAYSVTDPKQFIVDLLAHTDEATKSFITMSNDGDVVLERILLFKVNSNPFLLTFSESTDTVPDLRKQDTITIYKFKKEATEKNCTLETVFTDGLYTSEQVELEDRNEEVVKKLVEQLNQAGGRRRRRRKKTNKRYNKKRYGSTGNMKKTKATKLRFY
jgi:hypothetical protein